ncbi:LpxI family protein [Oceanomicrobium pacificus]|uniref:UDP-2,3-diacylglucosamine diphosphatase LpxI n=1 Tax=Oceanomicrobium pacificus TaxID=2692916 RepID=A0A6B0TPJ0_9RHOB|nr:UDP-2,3-diacylglucosamine diphosphatase LpxI [Oceanomicrobium pacificus]MXU65826.1 UDP-2,3-diacylglucosamine diphosphatase LpxI [Oceanomicrobium pacificus]
MADQSDAPTFPPPELFGGLGIISGAGVLPRMVAEECRRQGLNYRVVTFEGIEVDWAGEHPTIHAVFEKAGRLFADLKKAGCTAVSFAGGMVRPKLNPLRFDMKGVKLAATVLPALKKGDDETLRAIAGIFEAEGMKVIAPHAMLANLIAREGVYTQAKPGPDDRSDAARAAQIVAALGEVDVGQGAVVAQGICLATESIQGTDQMLDFVAKTGARFRPDPKGSRGVLLKAPKQGQDWRVDLPAIGPDTMTHAATAGLAGVVVQADSVLILGLDETVAEADRHGLFLWARPADPSP